MIIINRVNLPPYLVVELWPTLGAPSSTCQKCQKAECKGQLTNLVVVTGIGVGLGGTGLLLEELLVADGGEGSGLVNNRGSVNPLVNGDGLVNSGGLNGFSLDDGLN